MGSNDPTAAGSGGNPQDFDYGLIRLDLRVAPDHALECVKIEDATGRITILMPPATALDFVLRIVGTLARLKGWRLELGEET